MKDMPITRKSSALEIPKALFFVDIVSVCNNGIDLSPEIDVK